MKRLLLFLVMLVASCAPQLAYAQGMNTVSLAPETLAITYCQFTKDSVYGRTFIDEAVFADTALLSETRTHEASHRADIKQDWVTACSMKDRVILKSEVKAYCAEAPLDVAHGQLPGFVWLTTLKVLYWQFKGAIPAPEIRRAWLDACGKQLGVT